MRARSFTLGLMLLAGACDPAPQPDSDEPPIDLPHPDDIALEEACPLEDRIGGFVVQATETYTTVQGQVSDGVVPVSILEPIHTEGDCTLLRRNNPYCDPGCASHEVCDFDGSCSAYPEPQDLGVVTIAGLAEAVEISPAMPGYNYFSTSLPHPAMSPGDTIRVQADADDWADLELWGVGVEPLVIDAPEPWSVAGGEPLDLEWKPPSSASWGEIRFSLTIDQHGTSPVTLQCDLEDTGAAAIPASTIDALLGAGVSGWPRSTLSRRTVDSALQPQGCVELIVSSPREGDIALADYIPCDETVPCPEPLECNLELGLCE